VVNKGTVQCRVKELAQRRYQATFTPTQNIAHIVELKFNNEHVRHSPWILPFREAENGTTHHHPAGMNGNSKDEK